MTSANTRFGVIGNKTILRDDYERWHYKKWFDVKANSKLPPPFMKVLINTFQPSISVEEFIRSDGYLSQSNRARLECEIFDNLTRLTKYDWNTFVGLVIIKYASATKINFICARIYQERVLALSNQHVMEKLKNFYEYYKRRQHTLGQMFRLCKMKYPETCEQFPDDILFRFTPTCEFLITNCD